MIMTESNGMQSHSKGLLEGLWPDEQRPVGGFNLDKSTIFRDANVSRGLPNIQMRICQTISNIGHCSPSAIRRLQSEMESTMGKELAQLSPETERKSFVLKAEHHQ